MSSMISYNRLSNSKLLPKIITFSLLAILIFFILLTRTRRFGGWYAYYAEYILSMRSLSDIGPKCYNMLDELETWRRGFPNLWWYRRMRCEGQLYGESWRFSVKYGWQKFKDLIPIKSTGVGNAVGDVTSIGSIPGLTFPSGAIASPVGKSSHIGKSPPIVSSPVDISSPIGRDSSIVSEPVTTTSLGEESSPITTSSGVSTSQPADSNSILTAIQSLWKSIPGVRAIDWSKITLPPIKPTVAGVSSLGASLWNAIPGFPKINVGSDDYDEYLQGVFQAIGYQYGSLSQRAGETYDAWRQRLSETIASIPGLPKFSGFWSKEDHKKFVHSVVDAISSAAGTVGNKTGSTYKSWTDYVSDYIVLLPLKMPEIEIPSIIDVYTISDVPYIGELNIPYLTIFGGTTDVIVYMVGYGLFASGWLYGYFTTITKRVFGVSSAVYILGYGLFYWGWLYGYLTTTASRIFHPIAVPISSFATGTFDTITNGGHYLVESVPDFVWETLNSSIASISDLGAPTFGKSNVFAKGTRNTLGFLQDTVSTVTRSQIWETAVSDAFWPGVQTFVLYLLVLIVAIAFVSRLTSFSSEDIRADQFPQFFAIFAIPSFLYLIAADRSIPGLDRLYGVRGNWRWYPFTLLLTGLYTFLSVWKVLVSEVSAVNQFSFENAVPFLSRYLDFCVRRR